MKHSVLYWDETWDTDPRLILHPDELDELRRRSRSSHVRFYRALVEDLEGRLGEGPPEDLWGLEEPDYSDLLEICRWW